MEIDLGKFGEFITSRQFIGGIAIALPVGSILLLVIYRIVKPVPFLKQFMQIVLLTFAASFLFLMPFVFVSAFTDVPLAKLIATFFVIVINCSIFFIFNSKTCIKFLMAWSKRKTNGS